jgi:hypothetical protein
MPREVSKPRCPSLAKASWFGLVLLASISLLADSITVHLKNGDKITGEIVSNTTNEVVLTHPVFGRLTIPAGQIDKKELLPQPIPPAQTSQLPNAPVSRESNTNAPTLPAGPFNTPSAPTHMSQKPEPKKEEKPKTEEKPKGPKLWNTELQFGLNLRYSTKDQQEYLVLAKSTYAKPPFRHIFDYNFNYGRTEGIISGDKMVASEKTEFDLSKKTYIFSLLGGGYDQIRRIDAQYELSPGVGWNLLQRSNFVFKTEVGFTYQEQFRSDDSDQKTYSGRLAEMFTWRIFDKLTADGKIEFFPNLTHFGDYRLRLEGTLRYPLNNLLSFNLVVIDLYDTLPAPDVERNDLQIRSTLGIKF